MNRVAHWEWILDQALASYSNAEFEYGKCDCFLFTMDVLSQITGEDWRAKSCFPEYSNKISATKHLKELHDGSVVNLMDSMADQKEVAFIQRGNVVAVEFEGAFALGIFAYPSAKFVAERGLMTCGISQIKYAWET